MQNENYDKAAEIIREFDHVASNRTNWESHWQEIAERIMPSQNVGFNTKTDKYITEGAKKTEFIYDSAPSSALNRFASILDSLLTPRNSMWHKLIASSPDLNKDRETVLWFEETNRLLSKYRYAPNANFSSQNQQVYKSLGAFGTGALFIDDLYNAPGLRYKAIHLRELFFVENHQGMVDKVMRHFPLTARQCWQKWGEKCSKKMKDTLKTEPDKIFWILHCVMPNTEIDFQRFDYKGMKFSSYYICMDDKCILDEGGYNSFPYATSRYEQSPGELYGRSPAMEVLPAIKTLYEQKKTSLTQGHRAVNPIILLGDDGNLSLKPGSLNYGMMSADGRPLATTLPTGNFQIALEMMDSERAAINDAFLVSLFQILTETGAMTATEVLERTREKGILLAPTLGRQQSEYLGPMIDRELDLLSRQGLLPPMPPALLEAKGEYNVQYESPLSRSQRAEEASGLMRTFESILNIVNVTQDPSPLDHFNMDTIVPEIAAIQGVPTKWLNSAQMIGAMRENRSQQMQAQQEQQAAPGQAALISSGAKAYTAISKPA